MAHSTLHIWPSSPDPGVSSLHAPARRNFLFLVAYHVLWAEELQCPCSSHSQAASVSALSSASGLRYPMPPLLCRDCLLLSSLPPASDCTCAGSPLLPSPALAPPQPCPHFWGSPALGLVTRGEDELRIVDTDRNVWPRNRELGVPGPCQVWAQLGHHSHSCPGHLGSQTWLARRT